MSTLPLIATLHLRLFRDFPEWAFCLTIVALFIVAAVGGQAVVRPLLRRWWGEREFNDLVGHYISAFGVLYGITLGLISVAAWENFGEVETTVSQEAAAVAALYRTVDGYPEPMRSELTDMLRDYTRQIIDVSWPEIQRGIVPLGGHAFVIEFQRKLVAFQPQTEGQITLHREALYRYNQMIEFRRLRLDCVEWRLPTILWVVVLAGSLMSFVLTWLLVVENETLHNVLTAIMAVLLGLLIYFLLTLDLPFEGQHSVGPDSFELIYEQVMSDR
ncbi:MAG TPA: DUF4239 domain-containing protein [Opitutus sp.]|nr:DUF4239 domain-containing protein [Opitutus sp.]